MDRQTAQQQKQTISIQSEALRTHQNHQTKHLYEQVIRKNNETIKNLLGKLSSIYNRQQELQEEIKAMAQKMSQFNKREDNFQYQMRSAQLETKKQQHIINNDISVLKNVLKIPSLSTPHQVYLSSNFFQERAGTLNIRRRDAKNRTLIPHLADVQRPEHMTRQQIPNNFTHNRHLKHRSQIPYYQSYTSNIQQGTITQKNSEILATTEVDKLAMDKLQTLNKEMQFYIKKEEFTKQLQIIQANFSQKIDKIDQKKLICNWHLDFEQIQAYIDKIVSETLSQKVSKVYFSESLSNLKEAWQVQEKEIFKKLNLKLQQSHLSQILEKIEDLQIKLNQVYILQSFRIPNITYSNQVSPQLTPKRQSINDYFRADSYDTKITKKRIKEERKLTKNIRYSNNISSVGRQIDKKQPHIPWQASTIENSVISQNQWKIRASALIQPALIKKSKARKQNSN